MSANTSSQKTVQLETTPRVYYAHYTTHTQYDLYPGLARRLTNGNVPQRIKEQKKREQTNFLQMNNTPPGRLYNPNDDPLWRPEQRQQEDLFWDLNPGIIRNVENFGTDQMRRRLHAMENTITTL